MRIAREEIFGPVVACIAFKDEDDAIQIANDTPYGLAAAVWSRDIFRCLRIVKSLRAGIVWVNTMQPCYVEAPWGGYKQSGHGRELSLHGVEEFLETKQVHINLNVMEAALRAGLHYLDLGGLFVWTRRQLRLHRPFADAGLTAILGMGCAPGLTNVMVAAAAAELDRVDSIRIRVGGIDFNARNDDFSFPYSAQTIVEELTLPPWKWSGGRFVQAEPRSGWERVDFGRPVGRVWTVMTRHSEIATLPLRFKSRGLRYADFKVGFDRHFVRELMNRM